MPSQLSIDSTQLLSPSRSQILITGFLTGSAAATYPACGNILTDAGGLGFTSTQFGSVFVVQTLSAIAGALLSPRLRKNFRHSRLSQAGLFSTGLAMVALVTIQLFSVTTAAPYLLTLLSSLLMGVGIGLGISIANVSAAGAWEDNPRSGLTLLHTMLGLGLATSPLLVSASIFIDHWWIAPLIVGLGAFTLIFIAEPTGRLRTTEAGVESLVLSVAERKTIVLLGTLALVYGVAEATFSNWCVIYLHEEGDIGLAPAGLVLTGFWLAVMSGRLAFSTVASSRGKLIATASPIVMIAAFLIIAFFKSGEIQIVGYLLAGLGCAAVYPALLGLSAQLPAHHSQFVSGVMVATVLAGTGFGTYVVAILNRWFGFGLSQIYLAFAVIPLVLILGIWRIQPRELGRTRRHQNTSSTVA